MQSEWPINDADLAADLETWRLGRAEYDDHREDEYGFMLESANRMCAALRHHLYQDAPLGDQDLRNTLLAVIVASFSTPPDRRTIRPDAARCARLALAVMRKYGLQHTSFGGSGTLGVVFTDKGYYMLMSDVISLDDKEPGALREFFGGFHGSDIVFG
ncbi:MAG TPA: hypothetical protein VFB78_07810 [Acidimicrobiales bacterium]|nr:hypothetical protein [Acidimicrobiales bacterium]